MPSPEYFGCVTISATFPRRVGCAQSGPTTTQYGTLFPNTHAQWPAVRTVLSPTKVPVHTGSVSAVRQTTAGSSEG
jgi:hypothetical protein